MKKIINNGKKFTLLGYEIESGVSFMPSDFFSLLDVNKDAMSSWKKLVGNGVIEVIA